MLLCRNLVLAALLLILFNGTTAEGRRGRGRSGRILGRSGLVLNNGLRGQGSFFRTRPQGVSPVGSRNVAIINGRFFERDANDPRRVREIGIDTGSNALVGAVRGDTLRQVGNLLQRLGENVTDPARRGMFDRFLRANGFPGLRGNPGGQFDPSTASVGIPGIPGTTFPGAAPGGIDPRTGRPIDEGNFNPNGTVSAAACRSRFQGICSGGNNGASLDVAVENQRNQFLSQFLSSNGSSRTQFLAAMDRVMDVANKLEKNEPTRGFNGDDFNLFTKYLDFLRARMPDVNSVVNPLREELRLAIRSQPFSESEKFEMDLKLQRQRFETVPQADDVRGIVGWIVGCQGGFLPGAFAAVGADKVVLCPGLVLGAGQAVGALSGAPGSLALGGAAIIDKLRLIVTHELTHHIGADRRLESLDPQLAFGHMSACFVNNFRNNVRRDQTAEAAADQMAVESMGLKFQREGIQGAQAFELLKTGLQALCRDDPPAGSAAALRDPHPSNQFRIQEIAANNPRIVAAVCGGRPSIERLTCTAAGLTDSAGARVSDGSVLAGTQGTGLTRGGVVVGGVDPTGGVFVGLPRQGGVNACARNGRCH